MSKCPYTYPHRSKADQIEYLVSHESRHGDHRWYPLVWNVKIYNVDRTGVEGEHAVRRWLDERWSEHVDEEVDSLWNCVTGRALLGLLPIDHGRPDRGDVAIAGSQATGQEHRLKAARDERGAVTKKRTDK